VGPLPYLSLPLWGLGFLVLLIVILVWLLAHHEGLVLGVHHLGRRLHVLGNSALHIGRDHVIRLHTHWRRLHVWNRHSLSWHLVWHHHHTWTRRSIVLTGLQLRLELRRRHTRLEPRPSHWWHFLVHLYVTDSVRISIHSRFLVHVKF
jgi:hypothetical protein